MRVVSDATVLVRLRGERAVRAGARGGWRRGLTPSWGNAILHRPAGTLSAHIGGDAGAIRPICGFLPQPVHTRSRLLSRTSSLAWWHGGASYPSCGWSRPPSVPQRPPVGFGWRVARGGS